MRSSSSAARQVVMAGDAREFAEWAPDIIPAGAARRLVAPTPAEMNAAIGEAVAEAVASERAQFAARQAELEAAHAAELERVGGESYDKGFEAGRAEGELAEGARLRNAVQAAEEALDALRSGEVRWTGGIEENICALSVIIARQIIGVELRENSEPVANLVRSALAEFPIDQPIRIRINPTDLNALGSVGVDGTDPLPEIAKDRDARWLPDASIAPGGCVVEGRERIIDGRIDTALERVYRRLTYTNA